MDLRAKIELESKVLTWGIDEPVTPELVVEIAKGIERTNYLESEVYRLFQLVSAKYDVNTLVERLFDEDKELLAELAMLLVLHGEEFELDEKTVAEAVVFTRLYLPVLLAIIVVELGIDIDM